MENLKYTEILQLNKSLVGTIRSKPFEIGIISNVVVNSFKEVLEYSCRLNQLEPKVEIGNFDNIVQDSIVFNKKDLIISIITEHDMRLTAIIDAVHSRMIKQGLDPRCLDESKPHYSSGMFIKKEITYIAQLDGNCRIIDKLPHVTYVKQKRTIRLKGDLSSSKNSINCRR